MPAADYAVPDVIVRKTRRGWQVTLNSAAVPRLQINGLYAQMLGNQKESATPVCRPSCSRPSG